MSNFVIGLVRTWVPILVGSGFSFLVTWGVDLSAETQAATVVALTGLAIGLYYTGIRFLAKKWPSIGILLGVNEAPSYGSSS